jgi:hypothetical protein
MVVVGGRCVVLCCVVVKEGGGGDKGKDAVRVRVRVYVVCGRKGV